MRESYDIGLFASIILYHEGMKTPPEKLCSYCGAVLDELEIHFGDVCFREECAKRRVEADWGAVRDRAAVRENIDDGDSYPVVAIPNQHRRLAPLPSERVALFRAHLEKTITEAIALEEAGAEFHEVEAESTFYAPALSAWLADVCTSCKGFCCEAGGDTAFLKADTIRRILRREPGISREAIVDRYLSRLPDETYEGACVFQGAEGCALPRRDRANLCNVYMCRGLKTAKRNWDEHGTRRAFLARLSPGGLESYTFLTGEDEPS